MKKPYFDVYHLQFCHKILFNFKLMIYLFYVLISLNLVVNCVTFYYDPLHMFTIYFYYVYLNGDVVLKYSPYYYEKKIFTYAEV